MPERLPIIALAITCTVQFAYILVAPPSWRCPGQAVAQRAASPLLTATYAQFTRWVDTYFYQCNRAVFGTDAAAQKYKALCLDDIKRKVALETNYSLTSAEIEDPRVREHYLRTMKLKD